MNARFIAQAFIGLAPLICAAVEPRFQLLDTPVNGYFLPAAGASRETAYWLPKQLEVDKGTIVAAGLDAGAAASPAPGPVLWTSLELTPSPSIGEIRTSAWFKAHSSLSLVPMGLRGTGFRLSIGGTSSVPLSETNASVWKRLSPHIERDLVENDAASGPVTLDVVVLQRIRAHLDRASCGLSVIGVRLAEFARTYDRSAWEYRKEPIQQILRLMKSNAVFAEGDCAADLIDAEPFFVWQRVLEAMRNNDIMPSLLWRQEAGSVIWSWQLRARPAPHVVANASLARQGESEADWTLPALVRLGSCAGLSVAVADKVLTVGGYLAPNPPQDVRPLDRCPLLVNLPLHSSSQRTCLAQGRAKIARMLGEGLDQQSGLMLDRLLSEGGCATNASL